MPNGNVPFFPNKEQLSVLYESFRPVFTAVLSDIETKLKSVFSLNTMPTCKARIKDFSSYYRKLLRIKPAGMTPGQLPVLTDILGVRVICAFLQDLSAVEKQISDNFSVIETEHKGADLTFREFGYESTHLLVRIPDDIAAGYDLPDGLVCEIQIRTILQDAWAEVEHELVYKAEFSPFDLPLKRKLASMNASLCLADIIFQEIRDYQAKLNRELDRRRDSFYGKAEHLFHDQFSDVFEDGGKTNDSIVSPSPYVQGTIDDLMLEAIHAHNSGQFERAETIYTHIIDAKPNNIVLSVMYKHRGMAYFSQGQYEHALDDFKKSVETNPENFRSYYYAGIVCSVLGDEQAAVSYYDRSLERNAYQAHVYYRRSMSLYHLGDYIQSLADLDRSVSLGLEDEDSENLRRSLVKKLEMD